MKLFSLRLTTLKSKLYAIVFASFVVRVVAFFALPNTFSNLAPDEGTYAALTEEIAKGMPVDETQFGEALYLISRALTIPASLLIRLGLSGLDAVRLISSLYGLLTIALVTVLFLRLIDSRQEVANYALKNQKLVLTLLAIFTFLPSHLVWSVLGLREAAMEFWVAVVFMLVFYTFEFKKSPSKSASFGLLIAIFLVFSSRPQVGWIIGISLLTYFFIRIRFKASQILIPLTLVALFLGHAVTTGFSLGSENIWEAHLQVIKSDAPTNPSLTVTTKARHVESAICRTNGQEVDYNSQKFACELVGKKYFFSTLKNPGTVLITELDQIPLRQELNKVGATSTVKTFACPITSELRLQKYFCMIYTTPYTTYTFLVRPILGADVTSSSSLFAAIENTFWLGAFLFVILMLIPNRRLAFFGALAPSLLFFSIYSLAAGAYEGNMGTAFRHKSLILWVVLLLIASTIVATQQRKAEREGISGSSQE